MDIDFVLDLPLELHEIFNEWAKGTGYDPMNPDSDDSEPPGSQGQTSRRFRR
jgi:hypothetical protein